MLLLFKTRYLAIFSSIKPINQTYSCAPSCVILAGGNYYD